MSCSGTKKRLATNRNSKSIKEKHVHSLSHWPVIFRNCGATTKSTKSTTNKKLAEYYFYCYPWSRHLYGNRMGSHGKIKDFFYTFAHKRRVPYWFPFFFFFFYLIGIFNCLQWFFGLRRNHCESHAACRAYPQLLNSLSHCSLSASNWISVSPRNENEIIFALSRILDWRNASAQLFTFSYSKITTSNRSRCSFLPISFIGRGKKKLPTQCLYFVFILEIKCRWMQEHRGGVVMW